MIDLGLRGLLLSSLILGAWIFWRARGFPIIQRLIRSLLVPTLVITAGIFAKFILISPFWDRNASRLVGAFCLKIGLPLYPSPGSGAVQSMNYPPLAALMYWPATFGSTPTKALLMGTALTIFYFYAPVFYVFYVHLARREKKIDWPSIGALFFGFVLISLSTSSLSYSAFHLHADAPALGFGALACLFCSMGALFPSALCAAAALWSKQSLAPLVIALPTYILIVDGRKQALCYVAQLTGLLGLFLLLTLSQVSLHTFAFNLIYIAKKPWVGAPGDVLPLQWSEMLLQQLLFPLILLTCGITAFKLRDARTWMRHNAWTVWALVALTMIPVALLNRCTMGGDVNAFSLTAYFLSIGAFLGLGPFRHRVSLFLMVLLCVTQGPALFHFGLGRLVAALPTNPQETAYHYARAHPGEAYFPWNPLSTLMAEGRLTHFEPAVADWELAGYPLTSEHYAQGVPSKARIIAYHRSNEFTHETTLKRLPQFSVRLELNELPGWVVYALPPEAR